MFPKGDDGTTIINGTIFVNEKGEANLSQSLLFYTVLKQFKDVLESNGVKEIESVGQTFNPELHEAITSVQDDNLGVQEIKEEYRKGYMIGDKVIRHSLVVVAN